MAVKPLTSAELLALPHAVGMEDTGRAFGIYSTTAGEMARKGTLPVPAFKVGASWKSPRSRIWEALGVTAESLARDVAAERIAAGIPA